MSGSHAKYRLSGGLVFCCLLFMVSAFADDKVPAPVTPKTTPLPPENFGRFTMEISSSFWQRTGTGTDKQEEHGAVVVMLNKRWQEPGTGTAEVHDLQGTGTLGWFETVNSPNCSFSASAKVEVQVTGTVTAWPTCDMDIKIAWKQSTIYPLGTCHGYPLDSFPYSGHEYTLDKIQLPLTEGSKTVVFHEGGVKSTIVFKDVRIDYHGLRCTEESKLVPNFKNE